jgi:hypothetical protein
MILMLIWFKIIWFKILCANTIQDFPFSHSNKQFSYLQVRALTRGGTQSMSSSMAKSLLMVAGTDIDGAAADGTNPREVGLPDRVHYHGQPIRVEISGPVHFLHATNMNVTTNNNATNTTTTTAQPTQKTGKCFKRRMTQT